MDSTPASYYHAFTAVSSLGFLVLFKFVSPLLSERISGQYKNFTPGIKIDWDTRFNSTIHAIIVTIGAILVLLIDTVVSEDPLWGDSWSVRLLAAFVVGYMIADLLLIGLNYKHIGDPFHLVHHSVCIIAGYHVMSFGVMEWFVTVRILSELSTPFVNFRWCLSKVGNKRTQFYKYNGRFMAFTFFCSRILPIFPYWYRISLYHGTPECLALGSSWAIAAVTCLALDILNSYWFMKILIGGCREEMKNKER